MRALATALLTAFCSLAGASAPDPALRQVIERFVRAATAQYAGDVRITVELRPGVACDAPEPYVAGGTRLWGQSLVAVRCRASATVFVPVRVGVFSEYVVTARAIAPGHPLADEDLAIQAGDVTEIRGPFAANKSQALGRLAAAAILPGQPLRLDLLRTPAIVQANQPVKLVSRGRGFSISFEGRAVMSAGDGETVQVRTASGSVVSGIARPGPVVEVSF